MSQEKTQNAAKLSVLQAKSEEDRHRIYMFRYRTLVQELGGDSVFAFHDTKTISDPLDDNAIHLYLTADSQVIASIRINSGRITRFPEKVKTNYQLGKFSDFEVGGLSLTTRFTVAKKWAQSQIIKVLLGAAYKTQRHLGSRFDFASCPPALVPLYEQMGYRRYGENFESDDREYQVPMVLLMEDVTHLRENASPFFKIAGEYENNGTTAAWFEKKFPDALKQRSDRGMDEERFWEFLSEKMHHTPLESIPLLRGLNHAEAKKLVREGKLIRAKQGDTIVSSGQRSREMFVVLQGEVAVKVNDRTVAELGAGAIFGETALITSAPRTADVVAKTDVEALVLTEDFLRKTMRAMPDIMVRVLFNLSMILAERLAASTQQIGNAPAPAPATPAAPVAKPKVAAKPAAA
ncbi:MAG: cyclic nucleotide-binding domain-containing protein [Proteobacteria bacterium]|nr:cyclic nucleotide-binding domain-containing protein [Pseudomonadota bacterium]MDA1058189.1 cyclic nucleotide-binding domain-containing protein [Pseudomonadota bacterium]